MVPGQPTKYCNYSKTGIWYFIITVIGCHKRFWNSPRSNTNLFSWCSSPSQWGERRQPLKKKKKNTLKVSPRHSRKTPAQAKWKLKVYQVLTEPMRESSSYQRVCTERNTRQAIYPATDLEVPPIQMQVRGKKAFTPPATAAGRTRQAGRPPHLWL